ncbi:hypothetical protein TNCV_4429041 [Trichonephila clavipes]|nr:hypothetical protein TNCV_4429041 [Trichonephila clavipes]
MSRPPNSCRQNITCLSKGVNANYLMLEPCADIRVIANETSCLKNSLLGWERQGCFLVRGLGSTLQHLFHDFRCVKTGRKSFASKEGEKSVYIRSQSRNFDGH